MWQKIGLVAEGGSVFNIHTNQAGQTWLVTGAGILHQTEGGWVPVPQGQPLPSLITVSSTPTGNAWWAGGLTGNLVRSRNAGRSWEMCWLDQIVEPVVCLAVSPRYRRDHTVLAGTNGAGVLRSTDGGRRWFLSNFGLQDFTILALAMAPDWSRREIVFAGTLAGVYRSSGGGRAWKQVGLPDTAVQALAISRQFVENGLIVAGTDNRGLYHSTDGGRSWQPAGTGPPPDTAINALLSYDQAGQEQWWAGTDDGGLWQSADGGRTWTRVFAADEPVLALAASPEGLLAGLSEGGLLTSTDGGQNWEPASPLFGRGWQRLLVAGDERLLALAPNDGLWSSTAGGQVWQQAIEASLDRPLLAATVLDNIWLAAWVDGLWRRAGAGEWQPVLTTHETAIAVLAADNEENGPIWAAAIDCHVWRSADRGATWQAVEVPFAGQQLLALTVAPHDSTLLLCSLTPQRNEVRLWRLPAGHEAWQQWLCQPLGQPYVQMVPLGQQAEQSWLFLDNEAWRHTATGWQKVTSFEQTVRRAISGPDGSRLYALVGQELFYSGVEDDWLTIPRPNEAGSLIDLHLAASGKLLALDITGMLWQAAG